MVQNKISKSKLRLKAKDVEYCSLIVRIKNKERVIPGVIYEDNKYQKLDFFEEKDFNKVIWKSSILEERGIDRIVVKDSGFYTIYVLNKSGKINLDPSQEIDIIYRINFKKLIDEILKSDTLEIKNRRYRFTVYPNCFIGRELVKWLEKKFNINKVDALEIGQMLIEKNLMSHVCNEHDFKDEYLFYRFSVDRLR